jgi:acyl-CoA thioester hydrolase
MGGHRREVEIRWPDMDAFGHVNNAVYLTYAEAARDEFLAVLCGGEEDVWRFVIRRIEIDFVAQLAQADRAVRVEVALDGLGSSSLRTRESLRAASDGRVVAELRTVMVHLADDRVRSAPIPDGLRARIEANAPA